MNLSGIHAFICKSIYRKGGEIYLRKYEDGKVYKPVITIEWILSNEYENPGQPVYFDTLQNNENSFESESVLKGENTSYKDEIKYLRFEITKLLDRK